MATLRSKLSATKVGRYADMKHGSLTEDQEIALIHLFQSIVLGEYDAKYSVELASDYYFVVRFNTTDYSEYGQLADLLRKLDALKKKRGHILSNEIFIDRIDKDTDDLNNIVCQRWQIRYWTDLKLPDAVVIVRG